MEHFVKRGLLLLTIMLVLIITGVVVTECTVNGGRIAAL